MESEKEKQLKEGKMLPLVEEFYTIQGEGYHSGKAAYFIRLGGCDIGCLWCDTKYSWNPQLHPLVEVDGIINQAKQFSAKAVVITGGEPLTYNLDYLCAGLKEQKIQTFIETSGAYPLSGEWDWICLSPKKQIPPLKGIFPLAHELKVIISGMDDFEWAEINSKMVGPECRLYLQPEWSQFKTLMPVIVEFVKENPRWLISLQAHKFMKIP